jgi:sugar phosphate isomerase/epimerase
MRLAISNITWDVSEDQVIATLLKHFNIDAIDVAPGKYFSDIINTTDEEIANVKNWWSQHGIEITGMQALLFGKTDLNIFTAKKSQDLMLDYLQAVCKIGSGLGAKKLVFGSPKNRNRDGLDDKEAIDIATAFFHRLGDIAQLNDVLICLEPNPVCYKSNFMINSFDTLDVVKQVAHPAIKMQFDTGALIINNENPVSVLQECASFIGHVHISEPNLVPLGDGNNDHINISNSLKQFLPNQLLTIEMLATKNESHELSIERAVNFAIKYYGNEKVGS